MIDGNWASVGSLPPLAAAYPIIASAPAATVSVDSIRLARMERGPMSDAPNPTISPMMTITMAISMMVKPFWLFFIKFGMAWH